VQRVFAHALRGRYAGNVGTKEDGMSIAVVNVSGCDGHLNDKNINTFANPMQINSQPFP
jgi:hypothetical protein